MNRFLNFILGFVFCFSLTQCAYAGTTKFMVVSDAVIDVKMENGFQVKQSQSIYDLQKTVKMINNLNPDFTVFLGDNIKTPSTNGAAAFGKIINKLKKPVYVLTGNSDVAQAIGVSKKEYYRLVNKFSHNKIRKLPDDRRMSLNLVFLYMDGVNQFIPGSKGYFKDDELIWLEKKLKQYKNDKVVIFQHFPVMEAGREDAESIHKVDEYKKVLSRHNNVIAIISGHSKNEDATEVDGIMHISVPSLSQGGFYNEVAIEESAGKKYIIKIKTHHIE